MEKQTQYAFHCNYRDVKHARRPNMEFCQAGNAQEVLVEFIRRRRRDQWTLGEVFTQSLLLVVNEETGQQYTLNEYGELAPADYKTF